MKCRARGPTYADKILWMPRTSRGTEALVDAANKSWHGGVGGWFFYLSIQFEGEEARMRCQACKTFEKQEVFRERAKDGVSVFYKPDSASLLPFGTRIVES